MAAQMSVQVKTSSQLSVQPGSYSQNSYGQNISGQNIFGQNSYGGSYGSYDPRGSAGRRVGRYRPQAPPGTSYEPQRYQPQPPPASPGSFSPQAPPGTGYESQRYQPQAPPGTSGHAFNASGYDGPSRVPPSTEQQPFHSSHLSPSTVQQSQPLPTRENDPFLSHRGFQPHVPPDPPRQASVSGLLSSMVAPFQRSPLEQQSASGRNGGSYYQDEERQPTSGAYGSSTGNGGSWFGRQSGDRNSASMGWTAPTHSSDVDGPGQRY